MTTPQLNSGQQNALDIVKQGKYCWLLGPPGTGKSFLIDKIVQHFKDEDVCVAKTATTGTAASLLEDAITLHTFTRTGTGSLKMHLGNFANKWETLSEKNKEKLRKTKTLIIDEAGMLSDTAFHNLNNFFRNLRGKRNKRFGGMQVILVGDIAQLPPCAVSQGAGEKRDEEPIQMDSVFKFPDEDTPIAVLSQFMRQADDEILQQAQLGLIDPDADIRKSSIRILNHTCYDSNRACNPVSTIQEATSRGGIIITPTKRQVEMYISVERALLVAKKQFKIPEPTKLYSLETLTKEQIEKCGGPTGVIREDEEIVNRKTFLFGLSLTPGQQVKLTLNGLSGSIQYQNGNICKFIEYNSEEDYCIVERNIDKKVLRIEQKEHKTEYADEVGPIGYMAFPIVPAISGNVHKVQGQTLDCAILDPYNLHCFKQFVPNMLYVMFSRVKKREHIILTNTIPEDVIDTPDVNKYLNELWENEYMKTYPRANHEFIRQTLVEFGI